MLSLTFMLLFVIELGWASQCDKWNAGTFECIQSSLYNNEYQWGTCVTDAYMKQKSNQKHHCRDRTATYCWYQCMLEVHNKNYGSVTSDCQFPVLPAIQPHIQTLSYLPHYCLQSAIVHQGIHVIGIATAWRGGIPVKLQVINMQSNTLNIFASCMTKTLQSSV